MRLRHKPWAIPEMKNDAKFFLDPSREMQGQWAEEFGNNAPIDLEIGCGRGDFIVKIASLNPDRNFIALDLKNEVLVYALRKVNEAKLTNVRIISGKAERLDEVFAPGEISNIYINFANPWPKPSHNKRRLTHPRFLGLYRLFTAIGSAIQFKTDDETMYLDSLEYFPEAGYHITYQSDDLPKDHPGNIETEYESKFRGFGMPIYRIDAVKGDISPEDYQKLMSFKEKAKQRVGRLHWQGEEGPIEKN